MWAHLIAVWPLAQAGCIAGPEAAIGGCHKLAVEASITACFLTEHLPHITLTLLLLCRHHLEGSEKVREFEGSLQEESEV